MIKTLREKIQLPILILRDFNSEINTEVQRPWMIIGKLLHFSEISFSIINEREIRVSKCNALEPLVTDRSQDSPCRWSIPFLFHILSSLDNHHPGEWSFPFLLWVCIPWTTSIIYTSQSHWLTHKILFIHSVDKRKLEENSGVKGATGKRLKETKEDWERKKQVGQSSNMIHASSLDRPWGASAYRFTQSQGCIPQES